MCHVHTKRALCSAPVALSLIGWSVGICRRLLYVDNVIDFLKLRTLQIEQLLSMFCMVSYGILASTSNNTCTQFTVFLVMIQKLTTTCNSAGFCFLVINCFARVISHVGTVYHSDSFEIHGRILLHCTHTHFKSTERDRKKTLAQEHYDGMKRKLNAREIKR